MTNGVTRREFQDIGELCRFYHESTGKEIPQGHRNHELAHYQKAVELGYDARFAIKFGEDVFTTLTIELDFDNVDPKDLIEIALAPEDPSWEDQMTAKNAESRLDKV